MSQLVATYEFRVWDADEFANREFPEPEWLIPDIVPGVGNNLIYSHGKIGKSILTVQLAHALTFQEPFLGVKPERTFKVLWLQTDLPEREWSIQIKKLGHAPNGVPWGRGWNTIWEPKGLFSYPNRVAALTKLFKEEEYDVLFLDSILSLVGDIDLNNPVVARNVFEKIESIVGPKPSWTIHHSRKGMPGVPDHTSTAATGSGQITAGASTLFYLKDKSMEVRGRFVNEFYELQRVKHGLWLTKTPVKREDPYATPNPPEEPDPE